MSSLADSGSERGESSGPPLRLSPGEVATDIQRRRACFYFLEAATEAEPRILGELRDHVWRRWMRSGEDGDAAVGEWLARWRIETPWSYEWAVSVLLDWEVSGGPPTTEPLTFTWPGFGAMIDGRSLVGQGRAEWMRWVANAVPREWGGRAAAHLSLPACYFDPLTESGAAAMDRIMATLTSAVRDELRRITRECLGEGYPEAITKTTGRAHFEWLAHYQVKGERLSRIAAELAFRDRKAVRDAIQATAELIALHLREADPPGRPRKSDRGTKLGDSAAP